MCVFFCMCLCVYVCLFFVCLFVLVCVCVSTYGVRCFHLVTQMASLTVIVCLFLFACVCWCGCQLFVGVLD